MTIYVSMSYNRNMRTSPAQFEIMLNFMELNGDLSKLIPNNPKSKIQVIRDWEQLTILLNSDPSGEKKSTEKWRKVWSDLKNNTKRKALKLKEALRNGGLSLTGKSLLSDFEKRVLSVTPGFVKIEIKSLSEVNQLTKDSDRVVTSLSPPQETPERVPQVLSPVFVELTDVNLSTIEYHTPIQNTSQEWIQQGLLRQIKSPTPPLQTENPSPPRQTKDLTPPRQIKNPTPPPISESPVDLESIIPAIEGQIPKYEGIPKLKNRNIRFKQQHSKQFRRKNTNKLNERFIEYVIQKDRAETEIEKERLRLREIELNIQKQWQEVAAKAIDALHKVIEMKLS